MPARQTPATLVLDSRTRMHALVRQVTPDEVAGPAGPAGVERTNALMMAARPSALLGAIDDLGPFWRGDELAARLMGADEARAMVEDGTLVAPDAPLLIEECEVDPLWRLADNGAFVQGPRKPRKDAQHAIARFGLGGTGGTIDSAPGSRASYVLEPLQDWLLARALVSVAMRLAATQRSHAPMGDGDDILTLSRFREAKDTVLGPLFPDGGAGTWVTPLLNRCEIARRADADGGSDGRMTSEADARVVLRPLGTARGKGVDGVRVLLAGEGEEGPTSRAAGVGRLYLALTGPGQLALANAYVSALDGLLGARRVTLDGYESSAMPVRYDSVACSLWATFLAHGGRYLMSCKRCGRTVLSTRQGPRREFCADTCRARYYMEQRTRRRPHAGGDTAVPLPKGPGPSVG